MGRGSGRGGQGGCERRIEAFEKIHKKWGGGRGSGGVVLVRGQCGCELNVGVGDDVGYGGCEPRIEGIVQFTKRYCTILRKFKKCGGGEG